MRDYFLFDGTSCADFNCYAATKNLFDSPKKNIEIFQIPGRNGSLSMFDGTYSNIDILYTLYINGDLQQCIPALRSHLNAVNGYARLEDTFEPDIYRKARFSEAIELKNYDRKRAAINVTFDCDPRRFLKSGEKTVISLIENGSGTVTNPTLFNALPLIQVAGNGHFDLNGKRVSVFDIQYYVYIDSELQEAYRDYGSVNYNSNVTFSDGEFPVLVPGVNTIDNITVDRVDIIPRWWII